MTARHAGILITVVSALLCAALWLYQRSAQAPDVGSQSRSHEPDGGAALSASSPSGAAAPTAVVERSPAHVAPSFVVLVVEASTREPLAGATVEVSPVSSAVESAAPVFRGTTRNDGTCPVPAARTRITVDASSPGFAKRSLSGIEPVAGETVVVALVSETPATILVRDAATRHPIAGARLFAQRSAFQPVFHRNATESRFVAWQLDREVAVTDRDGIAQLRGIDAGTWDFAVTVAGMLGKQMRDVNVPFAPSPLVVDLEPGHDLAVALVDEVDQPLREWRVQFRMPDRAWIIHTDERGIACSPGFAAGDTVKVLVPREDLDPAATFLETVLRPLQSDVVMPHPEPVRIVVSRARANAFRVAWPKGSESDRLTIEVLQEMTPRGYGLSQRLTVAASAGEADVGAATSGDRGRFVVQAVGEESGLWRSEPFFVTTGGMTVMLREVVLRSGLVRGRVLDAEGAAVGNAEVTFAATPEATGRLEPSFAPGKNVVVTASTKSLDDGSFFRDRLLPGGHLIEVRADDGRIATATVDVGPDTVRDLVLASGGRIVGRVLHHDPRGGERVVVSCSSRGWSRTVAADLDGRFGAAGLAAGSYTIALLPPARFRPLNLAGDMGGPEIRIDVFEGQETVCEIDAALANRRLGVEVVGLGAAPAELQLERLHPFDRTATQVWRLRRPVPRGGVLEIDALEPDADYVITVRSRDSGGGTLGWAEVPRGAERVRVRCDTNTAVVTIGAVPDATELALVPLGAAGVVARESLLRGQRVGANVEFRDVPVGAYRAVAGKHTDHCGPFTQSMLVQVGAGPLQLPWQPQPR